MLAEQFSWLLRRTYQYICLIPSLLLWWLAMPSSRDSGNYQFWERTEKATQKQDQEKSSGVYIFEEEIQAFTFFITK